MTEKVPHHFKTRKINAMLSDVNPRKEKHGDNRVLAADLALEVSMSAPILKQLSSDDVPWSDFCWTKEGDARSLGIKHFAFEKEYDDHVVTLWAGNEEMVFEDVAVKKFTATPKDAARVDLTLQIQAHPTRRQIGILCDAIMTQVSVKIDPPRQMELVITGN